MVDWKDPAIEVKIAHVVLWFFTFCGGLYTWEFIMTFKFDWECFRRNRPFRWTQVPYFAARYALIWTFVCAMCASNVFSSSANCTALWICIYIGSHAAVASASMLLIIRVIAIAERNRGVVVVLVCMWLAEVAMSLYNLVRVRGAYSPLLLACVAHNTIMTLPTIFIAFLIHLICLVSLIGLLLRSRGAGLWKLLLSQGLIYFAVTMMVYIPTVILLFINLNDTMNLSLQVPTLVSVVTMACRMYRDLVTYGQTGEDPFNMTTTRLSWKPSQAATRPIAISRMVSTYKGRDTARPGSVDIVASGTPHESREELNV